MQNELVNVNDGKVSGLMLYVDDQYRQGIISTDIAYGLKLAVKKVLSSTTEDWENLLLSELNMNELSEKFLALPHENISEVAHKAYWARTRRAINAYNEHIRTNKYVLLTKKPQNKGQQGFIGIQCNGVNRSAKTTLINYPFVLSNKIIITLSLPVAGLTAKDATRLKNMIDTMVTDSSQIIMN